MEAQSRKNDDGNNPEYSLFMEVYGKSLETQFLHQWVLHVCILLLATDFEDLQFVIAVVFSFICDSMGVRGFSSLWPG